MLYLVNESTLNGTVTLGVNSFAISAPNFIMAKNKLKNLISKIRDKQNIEVLSDEDELFKYRVEHKYVQILGYMDCRPLEVKED